MLAWLRSLLFNLGFFLWTALIVAGGLILLPLPWRWMHRLGRLWCCGTLAMLHILVGLRWRAEGLEQRPAGPAIYASKHQSTWDTLVFALLLPDCAYVLKRELFWLPLFGQLLARSRPIAVDRSAGGSALRHMLADAERAVAEGRSIVIFPEGTRTPPGERRPYHPGTAALYQRLDLPVVPVALDSGRFWGRRRFVKRPGTIIIRFLPPIAPGLERRDFMATLEGRIEAACRALAGAADASGEPAGR
jgi:1-acyl-sn-glycerol-3-phosphate acyltransferase